MLQERKALAVFLLQAFCIIEQNAADNFVVGPNRGEKMTLQPSVTLDLTFQKAQRTWRFAIFQAHSQKNNVTLSTSVRYEYGSFVIGLDVAVLYPLPIPDIGCHFYLRSNNNQSSYQTDVIAVPYEDGAPFPGACCLTCSMEFDPNIAISSNSLETNITFAFANVYYGRSGGKGDTAPPCDGNTITGKKPEHYRLQYHIYVMFLPEGDLSEESLFEGVEKMAYPARIKNHGQEVSTLTAPTRPVLKFLTYPSGQGIVYNVIVQDPQSDKEAAYSPVATYGCDVCEEKFVVIDAVIAVIGSIVGAIFCFFGFRLFQFTLFLGGQVNFGVVLFIIISSNSDMSHLGLMLTSVGVGACFGMWVFALWWFTEWTRLCLFINSLFLGFLFGATLMFTPFGALDVFQSSEFDYGAVLCACTVVVPAVLIFRPRALCIAYTSIVSSYAFVVGIDFFLHTSISYIVTDVILHASNPQFRSDHIVVVRPFQQNDIILSVVWVLLAVLGIIFQTLRFKKRQFPKSGFIEQKRIRKYFASKNKMNETTPILINSDTHGVYGANNIC